jgi:putative membrane protein
MTAEATPLPAATKLALERTRLAHERTLMAWVRTATSLISFGFTLYKFFQYLHQDKPAAQVGILGPRGFALIMIGIGLTALVFATIEHRRNLQSLRTEYGPVPLSLATFVAGLIGVLGVLGLLTVTLHQ